jgi:hypothetical protein
MGHRFHKTKLIREQGGLMHYTVGFHFIKVLHEKLYMTVENTQLSHSYNLQQKNEDLRTQRVCYDQGVKSEIRGLSHYYRGQELNNRNWWWCPQFFTEPGVAQASAGLPGIFLGCMSVLIVLMMDLGGFNPCVFFLQPRHGSSCLITSSGSENWRLLFSISCIALGPWAVSYMLHLLKWEQPSVKSRVLSITVGVKRHCYSSFLMSWCSCPLS